MKKLLILIALGVASVTAAYATEQCFTNCYTDAWGNQNCTTTCYDY